MKSQNIFKDYSHNINKMSSLKSTSGYIYLLQEREFSRLNEPTYKLGATTQTLAGRLGQYPKGSIIIVAFNVNDCFKIEERLKIIFEHKFHQCTEYGKEYFRGDLDEMKYIISDVILRSYNSFPSKRDQNYEIDAYVKYYEDRNLTCYQNYVPSEEEKQAMDEYNKRNALELRSS
jgi:hypothetical protein